MSRSTVIGHILDLDALNRGRADAHSAYAAGTAEPHRYLDIDGYIAQMFGPQAAKRYHASLLREPGQIQSQADVAGTSAFLATPPSPPTGLTFNSRPSWVIDYAVRDRGPVIRQKIWAPKKSSFGQTALGCLRAATPPHFLHP